MAATPDAAGNDPGAYYARRADAWLATAGDPNAHPVERDRARAEADQWLTLADQARGIRQPYTPADSVAVDSYAVESERTRPAPRVDIGPDNYAGRGDYVAVQAGQVLGRPAGPRPPRVRPTVDPDANAGPGQVVSTASGDAEVGVRADVIVGDVTVGANHGVVVEQAEGTFNFGGPGGFTYTATPADIPTGNGERVASDAVTIEENHGQYIAGRVSGTFNFGGQR